MQNTIILYLNNTRMKFPIPFFLIVLSLTGCASVDNTVSTQVGTDKDRAAIHQLIVEWERAFNAHDAKAVAATYAQDADFVDEMKPDKELSLAGSKLADCMSVPDLVQKCLSHIVTFRDRY